MDKHCQELIMSKINVESFGEILRRTREENQMPLRKLAALLDIDQSTLSKIERNERKANSELIDKLSTIFQVDKKKLHICFISDLVAYELMNEESPKDILKVAEQKIEYLRKSNRIS